jgi:DNA polymerase III epsilon subunit-like protein
MDPVLNRPAVCRVAIDVETSCEDPARGCLVSIGAVALDAAGLPTGHPDWQCYVAPGDHAYWDPAAMAVHGMSRERLLVIGVPEWQAMRLLCAKLWEWAGWGPGDAPEPRPALLQGLAHNAAFDAAWLRAAARRAEVALPLRYRWDCSMHALATWRAVRGQAGSCSLEAAALLARHWTPADIEARQGRHGALRDAEAAAAVWRWVVADLRGGQ